MARVEVRNTGYRISNSYPSSDGKVIFTFVSYFVLRLRMGYRSVNLPMSILCNYLNINKLFHLKLVDIIPMFISSLILLKFIFHQLYKIKHLEKIGIMSSS